MNMNKDIVMQIKTVSGKTIAGLTARTDNESEFGPNGKIPGLWQTFDNSVPVDYVGGERVYGVYFDYESDHTGSFSVLAGTDSVKAADNQDLTKVEIPSGKYLVFKVEGDMPQIAVEAWTHVWEYFSSSTPEYKRRYSTDFEYYPNANTIEVHIAIE